MRKLIVNASLPLEGIEVMQDELMFVLGGSTGTRSGSGCGCGCSCSSGDGCGCGCGTGNGCGCGCNTTDGK